MGLQKFKMSIANTIISQENASLQSMGTDQLLNLFTLDKVRPPSVLSWFSVATLMGGGDPPSKLKSYFTQPRPASFSKPSKSYEQ